MPPFDVYRGQGDMLQNYLITAVRNIARHKLHSAINVVGLAVGLAACIVMMLYVQHELSYDTHWKKSDRLVQLNSRFSYSNGRSDDFAGAAGPFKHALLEYFPEEVAHTTRHYPIYPHVFIGDKVTDQRVIWADLETFNMFDFDVISGDMSQVASDSRSLGLSATVAERLFGSVDVVGRVLTLEVGRTREDFKVAAVYQDLPSSSTVDLPAVALFSEAASFPGGYSGNWWNIRAVTYLEMKEGVVPRQLDSRMESLVNAYVPADFFPEADKPSDLLTLSTTALKDVRLYGLNGTSETVGLIAIIAMLILLIASINFINLSTAKGSRRAREVALRKTMGAKRANLMVQFLGESILMAFAALVIGLFFVEMTLPGFSDFVSKDLVLNYADSASVSATLVLVFLVGFVGGLYPAYLLSGFRPAETLMANQSSESLAAKRLRAGLVVLQFAISIVLIVAASVVYLQRSYAINLDPGFNASNLLTVQYLFRGDTSENRQILKDRALQLPSVVSATFSANTPPYGEGRPATFELPGRQDKITLPWQAQDTDYFDVLEIPLVAGRAFRLGEAVRNDDQRMTYAEGTELEADIMLNESAVKLLGFGTAEEALGKTLKNTDMGQPTVFTVIGVVADTRFNSMRSASPPQFFTAADTHIALTLRYQGEPKQVIEELESLWRDLYPEVPLYYYLVDDAMEQAFNDEVKASILLSLFSGLAIFVACLGLYGLAAYNTEQRTKEVGVRKVLGAGVTDIVRLFLWQFARPVLWANLIAWPVAAWVMMSWLETYPYRIDAWVLAPLCLVAGLVTLIVAWVTVGSNAARVARSNPITALRYE